MSKYLLIVLLIINVAYASVGTITSVKGDGATIQRDNNIIKAVIGKNVFQKDILTTDKNSKVNITMNDNTYITIGRDSALNIEEYIYDINTHSNSKANLNFFKGAFKTITGNIGKLNPSQFKLKAKSASIGIRGTAVEANQNTVIVIEGSIFLIAGGKTIVVNEGEISFIDNQIPTTPQKFTPKQRAKVKAQLAVKSKTKEVTFTTRLTEKKTGNTQATATNGNVKVNKDGTVSYKPNQGHSGTDTVTLTTKMTDGTTVIETITITTPSTPEDETLINLEQVSVIDKDGIEKTLFDAQGDFRTKLNDNKPNTEINKENTLVSKNPKDDTSSPKEYTESLAKNTQDEENDTAIAQSLNNQENSNSVQNLNNQNQQEKKETTKKEYSGGYQLGALSNVNSLKTTYANNFKLSGKTDLKYENNVISLENYSAKLDYFNKTKINDTQNNLITTSTQASAKIASLENGNYAIVWESNHSGNYDIYAQIYDKNGNPLLDFDTSDPDKDEIRINTYTTSFQREASIAAFGSDKFIISWQSSYNIFLQIIDSDGNLLIDSDSGNHVSLKDELQVNTYTSGKQRYPQITALDSDTFIVTWSGDSSLDTNGKGVMAQIFNMNGTPIGNELLINTYEDGTQSEPSIELISNEKFVVSWSGKGQGDTGGIFAQVFDLNGNKIGTEFSVNTHKNMTQSTSDIEKVGTDKFIISWTSFLQDGSSGGVYAQMYDSNANPIGQEFLVNTYTDSGQISSKATALGTDKFIVTWTSSGDQDGNFSGVFAQVFDLNRNKIGSEFQINTYTTSNQTGPNIVSLGNDKFIVSWTSLGQDGNSYGIYSQTFIMKEDSIVKSGELTYKDFNTNNYTSHKDIGQIAFTQKINGTDYSGNYTLHGDNKGEFIVGKADEIWTIDGEKHSYQDIFYDGVAATASTLKEDKIYVYNTYGQLTLYKPNGDYLTSSGFRSNLNELLVISGKTKSGTLTNYTDSSYKIYEDGKYFRMNKINNDGSASSILYKNENDDGYYINKQTGQLYGSNAQGFGEHGSSTTYSNYAKSTQDISNEKDLIKTYYQKETKSINSTGTQTFKGRTSYYNIAINNISSSSELKFDLNRDTGTISNSYASFFPSGSSILSHTPEVSMNGSVNNLSSYYINDDIFGMLINSGTTGDGKNYISNTGWFITIPDKLDGTNYLENQDNESSWGYWTASFKDAANTVDHISHYSTWVAGVETDINIIQKYINDSDTFTFKGHMIGAVLNKSTKALDPILLDNNNNLTMHIDFGSGLEATSQFDFHTKSGVAWTGGFNTGTITTTGFSTTVANGTGEGGAISSSSVNGKFYGSGSVKSIGGSFEFGTSSHTAFGSFKADKQP